ncbi:MAG: tetratricopeptide repeat protein, partial [Blastocatellia bacterium]
FYFARQYDQALDQFRKVVEMDANFPSAHRCLGLVYIRQARYEEAVAALRQAVALAGDDPLMIATLGCLHAIRGQRAEARQTLAELRELSDQRYVSPYHFALIHADLGERTQAFEWFERAFEDRASNLIWAGTDPKLDGLRADSLQDKNRQVASAQCFRGGIPNLPLAQYLVGTGALMMSTASRLFEKYAKTTVFLEAL